MPVHQLALELAMDQSWGSTKVVREMIRRESPFISEVRSVPSCVEIRFFVNQIIYDVAVVQYPCYTV